MRVALVSDFVDPGYWGGAARVITEQALALKDIGHDVCLLGASYSLKKVEGIQHHNWPRSRGVWSFLSQRKYIVKYLKEFKADLILLHQPLSADIVHKNFPDIKTHYFFHSSWVDEVISHGKRFGLNTKRKIELRVLKRANKILCASSYSKKILSRFDVDQSKITVNPLAVNNPPFSVNPESKNKIREKYHVRDDQTLLCTFRRLIPRTGIDLFIDFIAFNKECFALLGGSGEFEERYKQKVIDLKLSDRIKFLGYVEQDDMIEVLQGSDIAVVPSIELEGFGLFTIEALSCGCPVLATNVGNNTELLTSCGFAEMLASGMNVESLNEAYKSLDLPKYDRSLISETIKSKFSWQQHAQTMIS